MKKKYHCQYSDKFGISDEEIVLDDDDPEENYKHLLEIYNEQEKYRYGEKAVLRTFVSITLSDDQMFVKYCNFQKVNLVTQGDKDGTFDLMKCTVCGKRRKRRTLGGAMREICKGKGKGR